MLGQSILDDISSAIQGQVGKFLQLRVQLNEMVKSPVLTISDKAAQLLVAQTDLENQLPTAISQGQTGSASDMIAAGGFLLLMEKQIHDVNNLTSDYNALGESAKPTLISGVPNWAVYAAGGLVLFIALKKRKR